MTLVLAVDPGKVCGWALWNGIEVVADQIPVQDFLEFADWLIDSSFHVVWEKFTINQRTVTKSADAHYAIEAIGCLRYWCTRRGATFEAQTPAAAKGFATDQKLRMLGLYVPTKGGHRNDACRHMLSWMARNSRSNSEIQRLLLPLLTVD